MVHWLEQHQFICIYKHFFGIRCPTCGFQSSFIYLLKGDLQNSFAVYPPLIPTLLVFVMLFSWLIFRKPSWKTTRIFVIGDLFLIFTTWLIL
jgi:hypothetical protein